MDEGDEDVGLGGDDEVYRQPASTSSYLYKIVMSHLAYALFSIEPFIQLYVTCYQPSAYYLLFIVICITCLMD